MREDSELVAFQKNMNVTIKDVIAGSSGIIVTYYDLNDSDEEVNSYMELKLTDEEDIKRALKSGDLCSVIWNFQQYLRSILKYSPEDPKHKDYISDEQYKMVERINDKFYDILSDSDVNLDEIWT